MKPEGSQPTSSASGRPSATKRQRSNSQTILNIVIGIGAMIATLQWVGLLLTPDEDSPEMSSQQSRKATCNSVQSLRSLRLDELIREDGKEEAACSEDWLRPKVAKAATDADQMSIPRRIHQGAGALNATKCVASDTIGRWSGLDGFSYYFHDANDMRRLMYEADFTPLLGQISTASRCFEGRGFLPVIWKFVLLWYYGGIYIAPHLVPSESYMEKLAKGELDFMVPASDDASAVEAVFVRNDSNQLSEFVFAASPKHPIFYWIIAQMLQDLMKASQLDAWQPLSLERSFAVAMEQVDKEKEDNVVVTVLSPHEKDNLSQRQVDSLEALNKMIAENNAPDPPVDESLPRDKELLSKSCARFLWETDPQLSQWMSQSSSD